MLRQRRSRALEEESRLMIKASSRVTMLNDCAGSTLREGTLVHKLFSVKMSRLRDVRCLTARVMKVCAAAAAMSLVACGSAPVLIGTRHAPVPPDSVRLYLEPIARKYEEIAVVDASSRGSFSFTYEGKADVVIDRLKQAAAKLGANGILLQELTDTAAGSVGAGVAATLPGDHGSIGIGLNGAGLFAPRFGRAVAVYVLPE